MRNEWHFRTATYIKLIKLITGVSNANLPLKNYSSGALPRRLNKMCDTHRREHRKTINLLDDLCAPIDSELSVSVLPWRLRRPICKSLSASHSRVCLRIRGVSGAQGRGRITEISK